MLVSTSISALEPLKLMQIRGNSTVQGLENGKDKGQSNAFKGVMIWFLKELAKLTKFKMMPNKQ